MSEHFYIARGKQKLGAYSKADLFRLGTSGQILPSDMIWWTGAAKWVPATEVVGLLHPLAVQPLPPGILNIPLASPVCSKEAARQPRTFVDFIFIAGALTAIPCWLLGDVLGLPLLQVIAGILLLAFAIRSHAMSRVLRSTGTRPRRSRWEAPTDAIAFVLGLILLIGGARDYFRKPSVADAENFVRREMEKQINRKLDSVRMREAPDGDFVGEARLGSAVWDVKVAVDGRNLSWSARISEPTAKADPFAKARRFTKDENATLAYTGKRGGFAFYLVPGMWQQAAKPESQIAEVEFAHKDGELYAMVISDRRRIPFDALEKLVTEELRISQNKATVVEKELRIVNGNNVLSLAMNTKQEGVAVTVYCYYYSGDEGSIQVLTWTGQDRFHELRPEMEAFLNGFDILRK